jgi:hypothetical protein
VTAVCNPVDEATTPLGSVIAGKLTGKEEATGVETPTP